MTVYFALRLAMYCVVCDAVTNSSQRCPCCAGDLVALTNWITPMPEKRATDAEPLGTLYGLCQGLLDSDDGAAFLNPPEPSRYTTQEAAEQALDSIGVGRQKEIETYHDRIERVVSAWRVNGMTWCVVKISAK